MEIILENKDIENLIRSKYKGIKAISFNVKKVKIKLEINPEDFLQTPIETTPIRMESTTKTPKLTEEQSFDEARKRGSMAEGGSVRTMVNL